MGLQKSAVLSVISANKKKLEQEFDVKELYLFGSVARDESNKDSDLDFLVTFRSKSTADNYFGLQFFLEDTFHCRVDLVTEKALRPELRESVHREAINA